MMHATRRWSRPGLPLLIGALLCTAPPLASPPLACASRQRASLRPERPPRVERRTRGGPRARLLWSRRWRGAAEPAPAGYRAGWSDAAAGGWNAREHVVSGIRRIPIDRLATINADPGLSSTLPPLERADGRAVVLVPVELDPTRPVEVLLHMHGFNPGYRQPLAGGLEEPIRDRDIDRIEAQMCESGRRQLLAILPQGGLTSGFSPAPPARDRTRGKAFESDSFIREVLTRLHESGLLAGGPPAVSRVILSAHSGGGEALGEMLEDEQLRPADLAMVLLFDAINGPRDELPRIERWLQAQLDQDLSRLRGLPPSSQRDYLRESLRFRAYYTLGSRYTPLHTGLSSANPPPLSRFLEDWFRTHAGPLAEVDGLALRLLRDNYQVLPAPRVSHDSIMGAGHLRDALRSLPEGPTFPQDVVAVLPAGAP